MARMLTSDFTFKVKSQVKRISLGYRTELKALANERNAWSLFAEQHCNAVLQTTNV